MISKENINTEKYWNNRFAGKDANSWKRKQGEYQTVDFAYAIAKRLEMDGDFSGTVLDFGCALGDALPVYKQHYPPATFIGVDFSSIAIEQCREKFGDMATFICGDVNAVPNVDVIIVSNVLEHLSDDKDIVRKLLGKCNDLYIAVPYDEKISGNGEHINSYNEHSFDNYDIDADINYQIYLCRGYNLKRKLRSYYDIELKNLLRPFFGRSKSKGGAMRQILFHITNRLN
jgi:hypothetical protein